MAHSGYDKQRFTSLGFDEFDCLICTQVAMDPMECDSCGKLFCKPCITDWISKNPAIRCPQKCNSQIIAVRSKALIKVYKNLDIKCSNPKCDKICKLGDIDAHEDFCLKPKCWNFQICDKPVNQRIKDEKPCCSSLCQTFLQLTKNFGKIPEMFKIISSLKNEAILSSNSINDEISSDLCWDTKKFGTGIVISEANTHVFLKEQAFVFRSAIGSTGFTSGVNYWEIIADARTENELKIGITSSRDFEMNSAFCDFPFGWAYYGMAQLRHGSNATGPAYGKKFKKEGILGICLDMNKGTLSFAFNGENMGVAFQDEKLKTGTFYPAVALLHSAGCKIRGGMPVPSYFR